MSDEIGQMAGAIWHALNTHGELSIPRLKKLVEGKAPVFDWAIGWPSRPCTRTAVRSRWIGGDGAVARFVRKMVLTGMKRKWSSK